MQNRKPGYEGEILFEVINFTGSDWEDICGSCVSRICGDEYGRILLVCSKFESIEKLYNHLISSVVTNKDREILKTTKSMRREEKQGVMKKFEESESILLSVYSSTKHLSESTRIQKLIITELPRSDDGKVIRRLVSFSRKCDVFFFDKDFRSTGVIREMYNTFGMKVPPFFSDSNIIKGSQPIVEVHGVYGTVKETKDYIKKEFGIDTKYVDVQFHRDICYIEFNNCTDSVKFYLEEKTRKVYFPHLTHLDKSRKKRRRRRKRKLALKYITED